MYLESLALNPTQMIKINSFCSLFYREHADYYHCNMPSVCILNKEVLFSHKPPGVSVFCVLMNPHPIRLASQILKKKKKAHCKSR